MRVQLCAACLLLAELCAGRAVRAQTRAASAPASTAPAVVAPPGPPATAIPALPLELSLGNSKLDAEAICRAIELELKRPISRSNPEATRERAIASARLAVVTHADGTVTVSYFEPNGLTRSRSIGLPQDSARAPEMIALLAGNLSRDEAAELLAGLAAKATPTSEENKAERPAAPALPAAKPALSAPQPAKPAENSTKKAPKTTTAPGLLRAPYPKLGLTLSHPVGLIPDSERYVMNGELGLVYSRVGQIEGVGLNIMVLRTEQDVHGWSFASFYDYTAGNVYGLTGSGLVNRGGAIEGAAVSGLVNYQKGDARWFLFGGIANYYRDFEGCSVTGLANVGRDLGGCSVAGIVNDARDGRGVQTAGIVNIARKLRGVQFAGLSNIAEDISGAQLGLVNVAGEVHGVQLGLVNIAKHVDGTSLGLVSVADNGRAQLVVWGSTFMPLDVAAKFTVGPLYSQVGGGFRPNDQTYTGELGLGAHLPLGRLFCEPGVHYSELRNTRGAFSHLLSENVHYRLALGLDLGKASPFVGVAVVQRFAHTSDAPAFSAPTAEGFGGLAFF